jgi:uncharacterized coiled-coil protein SlyX
MGTVAIQPASASQLPSCAPGSVASVMIDLRRLRVQGLQQAFESRASELENAVAERTALSSLMVRLASLKRDMQGREGEHQQLVLAFLRQTPKEEWHPLREIAGQLSQRAGGGTDIDYKELFWSSRDRLWDTYEVFRADATERLARLDERITAWKSTLAELGAAVTNETKALRRLLHRASSKALAG